MRTSASPTPAHPRDARPAAVVAVLVQRGLVAAGRREEAVAAVEEVLGLDGPSEGPLKRRLAEVAGYAGGALVVAAAAVFLSGRWDDLSAGAQVSALAVIAVGLGVVGAVLVLTRGGSPAAGTDVPPVRRRLAGSLFTAAAASAAFAVARQLEGSGSSSSVPALVAAATFAALSAAGYMVASTVLGQAGTLLGVTLAVLAAWDVTQASELVVGLALLVVGGAWLVLAERGVWRELNAARVMALVLALVGAQLPTFGSDHEGAGYALTALLAVTAFAVYLGRVAWPYLAAGVAALTIVAPEALLDWTDGAVSPAGVLLVTGATLLGASLLGLRLRNEVGSGPDDDVPGSAERKP